MDPLAEPIDRLNSQLNAALVQIGRTFRDAKGLGRARGQEQRMDVISKANTRFHEALDEIEIEIVQAKSVMERDLNRIRQAREAKERAYDVTKSDLDQTMLPDALAAGTMDLSAEAFADSNLLDQIQGIEGANPADLGMQYDAEDLPSADAVPLVGDSGTAKSNETDTPSDAQNTQNTLTTTTGAEAATDPNAVFDFETMFGDAGTSNAFDLDFSGSSAPNGASANAAANPDNIDDLFNIGTGGDDFADLGSALNGSTGAEGQGGEGSGSGTVEELESLLPGLASYVNIDGGDISGIVNDEDFAMIDLPTDPLDLGNTGQNAGQNQEQNKDGANEKASNGQNAADSSATGADTAGGNGLGGAGDQNGNQDTTGGMEDMDDIFGDMLDVGNMGDATIDEFDWNM